MENGEAIQVTESSRRVRGWLSASAIVGLFSLLMGRLAATPLGWLAGFCGVAAGLCMPQAWPGSKAGQWLGYLRWLWSLPVMAVSLRACMQSVTDYSYPGWNYCVPAALVLLLSWRGSCLDPKALERYGKLMMWSIAAIALVLVCFTVYMVEPRRLLPRTWKDAADAFWMFLLAAGAVSFVLPARGRLPGICSAGLGASMVAVTTGAESAALVAMLHEPFLTLCNAGAFGVRLGVLASALWVLGETAILTRILSNSPGGAWGKGSSAVIVFLLVCFLPVSEKWRLFLLVIGAVIGYIGMLLGIRSSK